MPRLLCILALFIALPAQQVCAQDSLRVLFIYGSKPAKAYQDTEPHWFGGKMGGHVGVAIQADSVLNFLPQGKFHMVGKRQPKHSHFVLSDTAGFYNILGGSQGPIQRLCISLPISLDQARQLRALQARYLGSTPYDYAFLGMRCAAATDEILAKLQLTPRRSYWGTIFRNFYPKLLRKRLLRLARIKNWSCSFSPGSDRRIWQR